MEDLRFPIGAYEPAREVSAGQRQQWIQEIATQPTILRTTVERLTDEQLDTAYRPGGWTIRQVVHHLADNNMNAYIRFRRALTEEVPVTPPYREDLWAELGDYREMPVELSLTLLEVLHQRFVVLLRALRTQDFRRTFSHATLGVMNLDMALHRFVWHGRHHIAQITRLCERMGWR
ncbi:YfiT family bacillithiol transferase [Alicyclobacillus macrosporangiidus]|uniref:YfiT family bacillithiol transferase n=1 Tax=Alicyclobacillus macrosporangiidus TaxID=392015 RepID=UPI00049856FB|nr:bacillithiol transferase BstA [Alicyclobacillus macrosporangiidus]